MFLIMRLILEKSVLVLFFFCEFVREIVNYKHPPGVQFRWDFANFASNEGRKIISKQKKGRQIKIKREVTND